MLVPFSNRAEAGRLLAAKLKSYRKVPGLVVVGLPRGGVPVAFKVANELQAPLDVMLVRKLGLPGQSELAIGAIAAGGVRILDAELIRSFDISPEVIESIAAAESLVLDQRERLYRAGRPALDLRDRPVILVDDGIAMGATMRAAVNAARQCHSARVVAAAPVASATACELLEGEADDVVCLATPEPFYAVSLWYVDFPQVSDEEVRRLLGQSTQRKVA